MKAARKALMVALSVLVVVGSSSLVSAEVIWSDNFNAIDGPPQTLDFASLTGRLGGLEAANIVPKNANFHLPFESGQLRMTNAGRIRFHSAADPLIHWDFAQGLGGAALAAPQSAGLRVEFDWMPMNNNVAFWTGIALGFDVAVDGDTSGNRVVQPFTDIGIILRNTGAVEYFQNSATSTAAQPFAPNYSDTQHVVFDFLFADQSDRSFADGKQLLVTASVGGTTVLSNHLMTLSGNNGKLQFQIDSAGTPSGLVDNLVISSIAVPEPSLAGLFSLCLALGAARFRQKRRRTT